MEIGAFKIDNSTFWKFSSVHFDNRLTFEYHMYELCKHGLTYSYSWFEEYYDYPLILRFSKFIEKLLRSFRIRRRPWKSSFTL